MTEPSCSTCGFFIPRNNCRDDLKEEMEKANVAGACGEMTQCFFFVPYISNSELARCGKHMKNISL